MKTSEELNPSTLKAMTKEQNFNLLFSLQASFPEELINALVDVVHGLEGGAWVTGGTIRDWILHRQPADLDITVSADAVAVCQHLIDRLGRGTLVTLGTPKEEAARVVWRGINVDIASFRDGANSLEEDLRLRDYTVNGLAVELVGVSLGENKKVIDPMGGVEDLQKGLLVYCHRSFENDPLRMLRGYRLRSELKMSFASATVESIRSHCKLIHSSAPERVQEELNRIMALPGAHEVIAEMAKDKLLFEILPELEIGVGMAQPGYHHEDVFHHALLALGEMDRVIECPDKYFAIGSKEVADYLQNTTQRRNLRWAALLHDCGKPATRGKKRDDSTRITFYNHDQVGGDIVRGIGNRLRWSSSQQAQVAALVEMHMHPFHLCNVRRKEKLSRRACLGIVKRAGAHLPGLFTLAMADSLAGCGEAKPEGMEAELAHLYDEVQKINEEVIYPVLQGERLITGHDLIDLFGLTPGPLFRKILGDLEVARVEGEVEAREEAISWLKNYLTGRSINLT